MNMKSTGHSTERQKDAIGIGYHPTPEAFSELVEANSRLIYKVSLRILKNHADAEDNLQRVLIKIHNNIHQFEGRSQLSSWMVRVAINEALMEIRKHKLAGNMLPIEAAVQEENCEVRRIRDHRPDPERQCIANQLLGKVLDGLSPRLRDAFVLTTGGGWTQQEFADAMGISVGTVKARIFRARTRMRQRLRGLRIGSNKIAFGRSSGGRMPPS
jgi:RNA polymerase sigma-70 factor (ECF subfamily)